MAVLLPSDRVPWPWLKAGESKPNATPLPVPLLLPALGGGRETLRHRAFLDWLEHQALDCAAIPPLAGARRPGNVTDLRLTIRNQASGHASVASVRSLSIGYLRSTSVVPP